jgi:hypothetical protein
MTRLAVAALALTVVVACGSSSPGATATPSSAQASAQSLAARPADFTPVALQSCPAPETGDFASFVAAYRTGVRFQDALAPVAAAVKAANADTWTVSMAAPDAAPAVCKGALGFAYTPRATGAEPTVISIVFVLSDAASAKTTYAQIQPNLVGRGTTGTQTGFGPDSALRDDGSTQFLIWLRGTRIAYLLTQDTSSWKEGAKAVDTRLTT